MANWAVADEVRGPLSSSGSAFAPDEAGLMEIGGRIAADGKVEVATHSMPGCGGVAADSVATTQQYRLRGQVESSWSRAQWWK